MASNTDIVVGILIVVIIVVIIVVVILNHGNELNVYKSLPNYHLINTDDNSYIGLTNEGIAPCHNLTSTGCSQAVCNNCQFPIASPFWNGLASSGYQINQSMDIWQFDPINNSFNASLPTNQSIVRVMNSIYNEQTPSDTQTNAGFLQSIFIDPASVQNYFTASGTITTAKQFILTQLGNNTITLQLNSGIKPYVSVEPSTNLLRIIGNDATTKTIFKLVPRVV